MIRVLVAAIMAAAAALGVGSTTVEQASVGIIEQVIGTTGDASATPSIRSGSGSFGGSSNTWNPYTTGPTSDQSVTSDQAVGLVLVNTIMNWGLEEAAGTGMIIDSSGLVVTNHHVVAGSTGVTVTDLSTGKEYQADIIGYDKTDDVAVLKLDGASGLSTITADTALPSVGESVTAVGNAEGGGSLVAAPGQIVDTGVSITVNEDDGTTADLTNLIELDANMVSGDSGGALFNSSTKVVGMNVAGSVNPRVNDSYAIPMATVEDVANQIIARQASSTVTLGHTAGMGIELSNNGELAGVVTGGPADKAGLTAGSVITKLDNKSVTGQSDLATILAKHAPGDTVEIAWTDASGKKHDATITLGDAPLA